MPVTRKKPILELQGRSRTIRSITGMIGSSAWTTLRGFYKLLMKFKRLIKVLFFVV